MELVETIGRYSSGIEVGNASHCAQGMKNIENYCEKVFKLESRWNYAYDNESSYMYLKNVVAI